MYHVALGAVDDVVVAFGMCGCANVGQFIAASAFGEGQTAALRRSAALITEWRNVLLLLLFIPCQQDCERAHQRTENIHGERAIAEAQFFGDEGVGDGLDCARPA